MFEYLFHICLLLVVNLTDFYLGHKKGFLFLFLLSFPSKQGVLHRDVIKTQCILYEHLLPLNWHRFFHRINIFGGSLLITIWML